MNGAAAVCARRSRRSRRLVLFFAIYVAQSGIACKNHDRSSAPAPSLQSASEPAVAATPASVGASLDSRDRFEIVPNLSWCEVEHDGLLLDLGSPAAAAYRGFGAARSDDSEDVERDGQ